ncbi:MAG: hypothetical protein IJF44_05090 [Clostridia bacterium]|nr:hypothetical protein [Clostridia bacterium]
MKKRRGLLCVLCLLFTMLLCVACGGDVQETDTGTGSSTVQGGESSNPPKEEPLEGDEPSNSGGVEFPEVPLP